MVFTGTGHADGGDGTKGISMRICPYCDGPLFGYGDHPSRNVTCRSCDVCWENGKVFVMIVKNTWHKWIEIPEGLLMVRQEEA
jgi:hypothetical protein